MEDTLLTATEAAELLRISVRTLEGWRRKGIGPRYIAYSSRCLRYSGAKLRNWLASHAREIRSKRGRSK